MKKLLISISLFFLASIVIAVLVGVVKADGGLANNLILDDTSTTKLYVKSSEILYIDLNIGDFIQLAPFTKIEDTMLNREKLCIPADLDDDIPGFVRLEGPTAQGDVIWIVLDDVIGVLEEPMRLRIHTNPGSIAFCTDIPENRMILGLPPL